MKRILIADDSIYQRKVLSDIVKELGHQPETVSSGEELLSKVDTSYDCIFLDLLMSGISGIEVLKELQGMDEVPPVVVITADVQTVREKECMDLGAAAFLKKITTKEAVESTLNEVLN